ncbi:MAG: antibiotic biosynthesis monooxygenase [Pirellulaceae bacterium]|nr:antibiotic biosynthesis monooxygenase [Pirellulaceae bacterium]
MFSIFVTISVQEDKVDDFIQASHGDAQGATRDEPGCFRFDLHQDPEVSNRFYLYEVYRDEAAFQAHLEQPHFLEWRSIVRPWFLGDPEKVLMKTVWPSEEGWEKQKPALLNW